MQTIFNHSHTNQGTHRSLYPNHLRLKALIAILSVILTIQIEQSKSFASDNFILDKAEKSLKNGDAVSAKGIYEAYVANHKTNIPARIALAEIAIRMFEFNKAQTLLEQTLIMHPDSAVTAASLGRLFHLWSITPGGKTIDNSRDYTALANEYFSQALQLDSNNHLVLSYLADWSIRQNDLITAEQYLQKVTKANPNFVPALQEFTKLYMALPQKDIPRARDSIFHAIELDPKNSESYFLVARLLSVTDHPAESVKYAKQSELLDFGINLARDQLLAGQYEKLGEREKAIQYYTSLSKQIPSHAPFLTKLGQLNSDANNLKESIAFYRQALSADPSILGTLISDARESSRLEQLELAKSRWEQLIMMQPDNPTLVDEALNNLVGLHYLERFYHPDKQPSGNARLSALLEYGDKSSPLYSLNLIKQSIANTGEISPAEDTKLAELMDSQNAATSGEAAFIRGHYARANALLELVDGISDDELIQLADRLLLDQELLFSQAFYQRVYQLSSDPVLKIPIERIEKKIALAKGKRAKGDAEYSQKHYKEAAEYYEEAAKIYRQWDNIYLKLGDTYEKLQNWKKALEAYEMTISLSPSVMRSEGFSKHYKKIRKKAKS